MTGFRRALPGVTMALMMAGAGAARADEGQTLQGSVDPMTGAAGEVVGCQASFGVARHDAEYGAGQSILAVGTLVLMSVDGQPRVALKIGILDPEASETVMTGGEMKAASPVKAVLVEDGGDPKVDNGADALGFSPSDKGFGVFLFNPGAETRRVLDGVGRNGRFRVSYAMRADGPMARFAADVTVAKRDMMHSDNTVIDPKAVVAFKACMAKVFKTAA
ncbi:MAG: hypothetical protein JWP35_2218 [Caulobacter sp.]|nr:hypothetical protein [Caulobacter sp.]